MDLIYAKSTLDLTGGYKLNSMKKIQLGNIYQIHTSKGLGLFQLVNLPKDSRNDVEMIKVAYSLYDTIPHKMDRIFDEGFFFVRFPVKAALRRKIIDLVGFWELYEDFELPKQERTEHYFKEGYWIVSTIEDDKFIEVEKLNDQQKLLSPSGVWNDTYLKERLEEGWRLENWE